MLETLVWPAPLCKCVSEAAPLSCDKERYNSTERFYESNNCRFKMSIATSASRFACLPDDEAADWKAPKSKAKSPTKSAEKKVQDNKPKDKNKASKAQQEAKALQNLAFGGQKKSKSKKKGKGGDNQTTGVTSPSSTPSNLQSPPQSHASSEPPEEWKERDREQQEDSFTQAMQQAIMLSQLEFEKKEELEAAKADLISNGLAGASLEEVSELSKEERKKAMKAGKAAMTMSLGEFNTSQPPSESTAPAETAQPAVYKHPRHRDRAPGEKLVEELKGHKLKQELRGEGGKAVAGEEKGVNFFSQMDQAALVALNREQMRESFKAQEMAGSESALVANYREKLVEREMELVVAKAESQDLREKLGQAKTRTKKLTEILMQAEMREKTEVLVQVHKLESVRVKNYSNAIGLKQMVQVRDELSSQLSLTLAEHEQLRSLVSGLETELRKAALPNVGLDPETAARLLATIRAVRK